MTGDVELVAEVRDKICQMFADALGESIGVNIAELDRVLAKAFGMARRYSAEKDAWRFVARILANSDEHAQKLFAQRMAERIALQVHEGELVFDKEGHSILKEAHKIKAATDPQVRPRLEGRGL